MAPPDDGVTEWTGKILCGRQAPVPVVPFRGLQVLANLQSHYGDARYRRSPLLAAKHFAKESFHG